jgi:hypothetical protein
LVTPLFATLYILLLIGIAALGGYLALYSWNRRIAPGAKAYAAFMATMACYIVCLVLEFAAGDLATKVLWSKMEYISAAIVPLIWLGFSLQFTERGGLAEQTEACHSVLDTRHNIGAGMDE